MEYLSLFTDSSSTVGINNKMNEYVDFSNKYKLVVYCF